MPRAYWQSHSRRIEPIALSQYPFCHGDRGAVGRSRMLIARRRRMKTSPYPHELSTTRLLARHAREHGPAEGHPCLANTKMAVARVAAPDWSCAAQGEGAQILAIERQDVEGACASARH